MVVLIEQIEIPASYEKMEAWTANFEEEFVKWSPYHIECNLYNGNQNRMPFLSHRGFRHDHAGNWVDHELPDLQGVFQEKGKLAAYPG